MDQLHLLDLHIEALFTHDADGRIRIVNEPGGGPAPRFFFGRTREGNLWRFRNDLPQDVVGRLEELATAEPVQDDLRAQPLNLAGFREALEAAPEGPPESPGLTYQFPEHLPDPEGVTRITSTNVHLVEALSEEWEGFSEELPERQPCWAVIRGGVAAAACFSSRVTDRAAEAGVETRETFRGQGFAQLVVTAWAKDVRGGGRVPLYSTSWSNTSSQAVASKLGLIQFAADFNL